MRHTNHNDRFINHDDRLGDAVECTIEGIISLFRMNGWDIIENDGVYTMSDDEIIEALNNEYDLEWID